MANDPQRDKARATFGKNFFENSKAQPQPKNSMTALQARANARPIPTFKVGGVVKKADGGKADKDFTGLMRKAADKAAAKGMPVMKQGGATDEYMGKRVAERIKAGNYKDGGKIARKMDGGMARDNAASKASAYGYADGGKADDRMKRKMADIEKDYKIALAKGKNENVAKAKYEQRKADAADDYAKWTGADRSKTSAVEKAAESALSEARRTDGMSIVRRDADAAREARVTAAGAKPITPNMSGLGTISAPKLPQAPAKRTTTQVRPKNTPQPNRAERGVDTPGQGKPPVAPPKPAAPGKPAAPAASAPMKAKTAAQMQDEYRAKRIADLTTSAAAKKKLEGAPAGAPGAALARLKDVFGFGSSGDEAEIRAMQQPGKDLAALNRAKAARALADQQAAAEKGKANAARVAKLRAAGRNADADFYERNPNALKQGGKPSKYAAGGAGKVRKGMAKGC